MNSVGDIFLPLVAAGTLQGVSASAPTPIWFPDSVLSSNPDLANVSLVVPADSLFADDGTRGGSVGIAPVDPNRLPGTLPPGLAPPLVICLQGRRVCDIDYFASDAEKVECVTRGVDEVRIAYVLNTTDLGRAMDVVEGALRAYPGATGG